MTSFARPLRCLALLALLFASRPADADRDRWHLLGTKTVSDRLDHDVVVVTGARGTFDAIKLVVRDRAVQFHSLTVHFASGANQEVELRDLIRAGGETRRIDIDGAERVIRSITMVYDAQSLGGKARVRVYGHG